MKRALTLAGVLLAAASVAAPVSAQLNATTQRIATGFVRPLYLTHAPNDFSRVFVVEQRGSGGVATRGDVRIMNIPSNLVLSTPFISITGLSTGNEQGLLGLAFHPLYGRPFAEGGGYFYVSYTESPSPGNSVIARYRVSANNPNVADLSTFQVVLRTPQTFSNHNGGWIGFGPDGLLYIALGDGGSAGDPNNAGQNINSLLGKTLRIDVDGPDNIPGNADDDGFPADANRNYVIPADNPWAGATPGADEVWAWGLRNHWRNSFDRTTGAFWIGDVGQNAFEEISYQPPSSGGVGDPNYRGGRNYGWRCYEGNAAFNLSGCGPASNYVFPVVDISHGVGVCSITGGYVYRGCAMPQLNGLYFFADYCTNQIWSGALNAGGTALTITDRTANLAPGGGAVINAVTSFGEDAYGELYIVDQGGEIYKIVSSTFVGPDCNNNGRRDACEILDRSVTDNNNNGIPDSCECIADWNSDGRVDINDFFGFLAAFSANNPRADLDSNGVVDINDFFIYLARYSANC